MSIMLLILVFIIILFTTRPRCTPSLSASSDT